MQTFSSSKRWLRNGKSCLRRHHKESIIWTLPVSIAAHHRSQRYEQALRLLLSTRSQPCWKPHHGGSVRSDSGLLPPTALSHHTLFPLTFEADEKQKRLLYPHSIRQALYRIRRCFLFHSCTFWAGSQVHISSSSSPENAPVGGQKCFRRRRTHISEHTS